MAMAWLMVVTVDADVLDVGLQRNPMPLKKTKTVRRRQKALKAFELLWNMLAVLYLVRSIQTSRFIPQHQDLAGTVRGVDTG